MPDYNSSYTGPQIDEAVGKALSPDTTPTRNSSKLITSGGVEDALSYKADIIDMPFPAGVDELPVMDGTANQGSGSEYSRWDHVHPSDTTKANQAQLATVESGSTASRAYVVGEYFCWGGVLYRATEAISSGGTFTPGTNCETDVVGDFMYLHEYPSENWFVLGAGKTLTIHIGGGNHQCQAGALVSFTSNVSTLNGGVAYLRSYDSRAGFHPLTFFIGTAPSEISINNAAGVIEITNTNTGTASTYVLISMLGCRQKNITFSVASNA